MGLAGILKDELNVRDVKLEESLKDAGVKAVTEVLTEEREFKMAKVDDVSLFLDITLDKNLIEEGLVRDLVRRIQGMRKDLDLEYTAKIRIMYESDEEVKEAINKFSDYICEETLAVGIEEGTPSSSAEAVEGEHIYEKTWKMGEKEVYLAIKPFSEKEKNL